MRKADALHRNAYSVYVALPEAQRNLVMKDKVFGDKSLFAIEVQYDLELSDPWLYGLFAYWVDGKKVCGEDYFNLTDIYYSMRWMHGDCGNRQGGALCGLPERDIVEWIASIIRNDAATAPGNVSSELLPRDIARFNLLFHPANGMDWLFLLSCEDTGILLRKMPSHDDPVSIKAPIAVFEIPIKESYTFLGQLQSALEDKEASWSKAPSSN